MRIAAAIALLGAVLSAAPASAVTRDHLQCFRIKDDIAAGVYSMNLLTANLVIPPLEPGCTLKMPARLYCIDTASTNVTPTPPGGPVQGPAQTYLCYKAKCNQLKTFFTATDQFGSHNVESQSTSLICAPVQPALVCGDGEIQCGSGVDATCVNPAVDVENCGGCGIACGTGEACVAGECQQNQCSTLPCQECAACSQEPGAVCEDEVNAFYADPDSPLFMQCAMGCVDASCLNMCLQAYPSAGQLYLAAVNCIGGACPDCGASCGDGTCDIMNGETELTCPTDCGGGGVCGDGVCEPGEENSCPVDCSVCGNGQCEAGEDSMNCPEDCSAICGNGVCEAGELEFCPIDCATCGDGVCEAGEEFSCPADCSVCGNGVCEPGENALSCASDCPPVCGNGFCEPGEDSVNCSGDCPTFSDGCTPSTVPTCANCACEATVCGQDPFCCNGSWDEICVTECEATGLQTCPARAAFCIESDAPSCGGDCSWMPNGICVETGGICSNDTNIPCSTDAECPGGQCITCICAQGAP